MVLYWDMSYFYASIGNIPLGSFIWINNAELEIDARGEEFSLDFRSTLTCLFFAEIDTMFTIKERGDEWDIYLISEASIFDLLPSSIVANATLDPYDLADSVIHNFDLSLAGDFFVLHANYSNGVLQGNFDIPALWSHGSAVLEANETLAEFSGSMTIFNGLFEPYAHGKCAVTSCCSTFY